MSCKRVTITDVARRAGVSRAMVSYVLSKGENSPAAPETRDKVLAAAKELGYRCNQAARSLRCGNTRRIGMIFPALRLYLYELIVEAGKSFSKRGYTLNYNFFERKKGYDEEFAAAFEQQLQMNVDAIITPSYRCVPDNCNVPVIIWDNDVENYDCVFFDKIGFGHDVIRRILALGHEKVAVCGRLSDRRYHAMREELLAHGKDFFAEFHIDPTENLPLSGILAVNEIIKMKERPDVLICHEDEMALPAMRAALDAGIKIPDELAVVSIGNNPMKNIISPSLATYSIDSYKIAENLAEVTLNRLMYPDSPLQKRSTQALFVPGDSLK